MANFNYTALNRNGQHISGIITAANRTDAVTDLRNQGNRPLSVREAKNRSLKLPITKGKVKLKDLVVFTRELSTMISAGVPLPRGLETLANQTENKLFKETIGSINHDVESGMSLADAMAKFPNTFSDVYVNMVRAGEAGGILDEILKRLADQVEKDASIRKKIHSAMAYPIVIMVVTVIAFFGIMLFILPKINKILLSLGGPNAKLPVYARAMLDISGFMQKNFIFIILGIIAVVWGFRYYIHTETGKFRWHALLLRMPVIGSVITKVAIARFSRTFSSLMSSGVSVLEALEVTGKAVGNKVIQKELVDIAEQVKNGQPLGKQLLEAKFFPPIVGQMMTVGEETGKIDQVLVKVADFYEEEVDAVIDSLASIIEPVMIIILGSVVGLIAASVMGPIASLSRNIGNQ